MSVGRRYSGRDGKAEKSMALLWLMIAAQANLFGNAARYWKYVNACATSIEGFSMDRFELIVAAPKKSEKYYREAQLSKLVDAAVNSVESAWEKQWV